MIIYCAGPIKGDTTFQKFYLEIIDFVESEKHTPLAGISAELTSTNLLTDKQVYKRDMKWIEGSKMMIAEISGPSLGVGFEIAYAVFHKKMPVLALTNNTVKNVSVMITGCDSNLLTLAKYRDTEDLKEIIRTYIKELKT
ncbi:MAG: nucleoside 2-deoxyribosyltransferase [Ignavibacteriaceae bacterium]